MNLMFRFFSYSPFENKCQTLLTLSFIPYIYRQRFIVAYRHINRGSSLYLIIDYLNCEGGNDQRLLLLFSIAFALPRVGFFIFIIFLKIYRLLLQRSQINCRPFYHYLLVERLKIISFIILTI